MSNLFSSPFGYPWSDPVARELHKRLVNTFFEPLEVRNLVRKADAPNWLNINWDKAPNAIWIQVLDLASSEGALQQLLTYIVDTERVAPPLSAFIRALLDDRQPALDARPGDQNALDFEGDVSKDEALLFGDDLSESVGDIPALIEAVQRVMAWRTTVCCLTVTAHDGSMWKGTGTLLTGNRVLTNHHVLFPQKQVCSGAVIEFGFERDGAGQMVASHALNGDVASIRSDAADDWAVISIAAPPPEIRALDLATDTATATAMQRAFILQHPDGQPKRLAFVRNRITAVADRRLQYLTDTRGGSSGAPVFNEQGQLVGIHRAGGVPQKLAGADPLKKNEGVRIDAIRAGILQT